MSPVRAPGAGRRGRTGAPVAGPSAGRHVPEAPRQRVRPAAGQRPQRGPVRRSGACSTTPQARSGHSAQCVGFAWVVPISGPHRCGSETICLTQHRGLRRPRSVHVVDSALLEDGLDSHRRPVGWRGPRFYGDLRAGILPAAPWRPHLRPAGTERAAWRCTTPLVTGRLARARPRPGIAFRLSGRTPAGARVVWPRSILLNRWLQRSRRGRTPCIARGPGGLRWDRNSCELRAAGLLDTGLC